MPPNRITAAGYEYGPTINHKMYLSLFKHRGTGDRRHKNMWSSEISPDNEYEIFQSADESNWCDESNHYWGVWNQGVKLGEKGERISKFPCPSNPQDPWHGYPASPRENPDNDSPSDLLVERWVRDNVISKEMGRKIQKKRI